MEINQTGLKDRQYFKCLRFFSDAQPTWPSNILRPSGEVNFQLFLRRRRGLCIWFVTWGLVDFLTGPFTFYWYITAWAIFCNAALWSTIYYAHVVNGDYDRVDQDYIEPAKPTLTNLS